MKCQDNYMCSSDYINLLIDNVVNHLDFTIKFLLNSKYEKYEK